MLCPACHRENDASKKFCIHCGTKLPKMHYCAKCGNVLNPNQKFCAKCGTPNPYLVQNNGFVENKGMDISNSEATPTRKGTSSGSYPVFNGSTNQSFVDPTIPNEPSNAVFQNNKQPIVQPQDIPQPHKPFQESPENLNSESKGTDTDLNGEDSRPPITLPHVDDTVDNESDISYNLDSNGLPVYDEASTGSSKGWIVLIIVVLLLAGGVMVVGQRIDWWNLPFLSWVGGEHEDSQQSYGSGEVTDITEATSVPETAIPVAEAEDRATTIVEEATDEVAGEPYSVNLKGTVGKYAVEMILEGTKASDGFYPTSGKYRYTANNGAWIDLSIQNERVINSTSHLNIKEYTNGNLTGTWSVRYDMFDNSLKGAMTNYKNDSYVVSLNGLSLTNTLKEGYNKITGDVVTSSKNYPFYIDFIYEEGDIVNAIYHNPDYNTRYKLSNGRISNGEFYFDGDHNGKEMTIIFSATPPYGGSMTVGSEVRTIKMNL